MDNASKPPPNYIMMGVTLSLLTLQVTSAFLVARYSRGILREDYIQTTVICFSEIVKLVWASLLVYFEQKKKGASNKEVGEHFVAVLKNSYHLLPPALMYFIQNFLVVLSLQNIKAAIFAVLNQLKILTTALFTVLIIRRPINVTQWIALLMLVVGVVLVKWNKQSDDNTDNNNIFGVVTALIIPVLSGLSGVYIEKVVKQRTKGYTIWDRNVQLAVWSIVFALATSFISDGQRILEEGWFVGYSLSAVALIFIQAGGGVLVALVIKYSNNVIKGFAVSVAIILASFYSAMFWDFKLSFLFACGVACVIAAIFTYGVLGKRAAAPKDEPQVPKAPDDQTPVTLGEPEDAKPVVKSPV